MAWDNTRSKERAQTAWAATNGLVVTDLTRAAEFENTALNNPRRVRGAHVYVDVPGFRHLVAAEGAGPAVARRLHVWAREITKVVESDFGATKVHFQGPRLHAVVYRPVGADSDIAVAAVLMAAAVRACAPVFNDVLGLDGDEKWITAAGVDFGTALLTKDGARGDRELLFLGDPANRAAKLVAATGLRLTDDAAALLPDDVAAHVQQAADGTMLFAATAAEIEGLCQARGFGWTAAGTRRRLTASHASAPQCTVVQSTGSIDKTRLGLGETKQTFGISLFADVDGFTGYVEQAAADDALDDAVRVFHVVRSETRHTAVADYDSLRIQYQGDRMQALVHLPSGDQAAVALKAVRVAAALNSVFAHSLPGVVGETGLSLAIGLAAGTVLVSKLGEHGGRDVVSLGASTAEAARIQEALDGGEIGIDSDGRALLPAWLQPAFQWRSGARAWVAPGLTLADLDLLQASASADRAKAIIGAPALVTSRPQQDPPLKPYAAWR